MAKKPSYEKLEQRIEELEKEALGRRKVERDLRIYETALESSINAIGITDLEAKIIYVNDSCVKMWGCNSKDEILGRFLPEFWEGDGILKTIKELSVKGVAAGEDIGKRKDGSLFYVQFTASIFKDEAGNPSFMFGSFFDITERKRVEEVLQGSEKRFRLLAESLVDAVYEFDSIGKFTYVNEAAVRMLGYSKDELLGNIQPRNTFSKEEHARSREDIAKIFKGETIVAERTFIRKDGTTFTGEIHSGPIYRGTDVIGVRGVLRNITDRKEMESHLLQSQKMEAIGVLAGGIAHQFNNALYAITGNIDLLEMDFSDDQNVANYAKEIKVSTGRMTELAAQLLAYARGGKYQVKTVSLNDFAKETIPLVKHTIDSTIKIDIDLPRDILNVKVDLTQMQMVLSAVLTNASEAMEGKGRIQVTCRNELVTDETNERFPGLKPGNYAYLSITDNGKGMDEKSKSRIFEPFFTTKFDGRGLGMAAAYGIVKNHHGLISIDSELDKGTIVKIYLPTVETPVKEDAKPKTKWIKGKGTILIIDDEKAVMKISRAMCERLGYRVLEAKTGQEAIDIVKTFDGDIDLAMLDILLPDIGGESIYPLLMKACPNLKVIVFSGYSIDGPAQNILDAGAEDFIHKPFTMAELSDKLKAILERE